MTMKVDLEEVSLSPANGRAFYLLVDTILPAVPVRVLPGPPRAQNSGCRQGSLGVYEAPTPQTAIRKDLKLFLGLLDSAAGGLVLFRRAKKFTEMPPDERAAALLAMEGNRVEIVPQGCPGAEDTCPPSFGSPPTTPPARPWHGLRWDTRDRMALPR